ncbi:MAG: HlyD family efflux transporter periplasmic adaptor subunit, partial [Chthoniobacteraceae bacterium]
RNGELRPLLEFLRALLNARALALFPGRGSPGVSSVIVTTRGILATSLAPIGERLANTVSAVVEPEPSLGAEGYTIAVPVRREDNPVWVLVAQLVVPGPRDLQAYLVILQSVAGFLLYREQRRVTDDVHWVLSRTSGLLDIFRRAGAEEDYAKACRIAVDALRDYFGCTRVCLAEHSRHGVRLRAMSGVQQLDAKSPLHHPIEAAMREALLDGAQVDFTPADAGHGATVAHEILQRETGAVRITTLPLHEDRGAVLLEWDGEPDRRTPALLEAALPFVPPLFRLLERARPNPVAYFFRRNWRRATANGRRALAAGGILLAVLLAWPFHYTIRCDCRLVPKVKRTVAAPFDGQLGRSRVQPGDRVAAGDLLVSMENRELKLKQAELTASRDQALKKRDRAMNSPDGADFSAAQVASLEAEGITQELALVDRKLAMLEVKAPIAGVVVSGDLRRAEGQPIRQGQVLFEVAPLEEMIVEADVPDREVSRVRAGMPVVFRLEAFSGWSGESRIGRVHPQSEQRDGANVFIAEAAVAAGAPELRPGMRGRAAIESDRRPLIWIIGHRFVEWVQTTLLW